MSKFVTMFGTSRPSTLINDTRLVAHISLISLELNDTMPKLGLILLIKEMKAKRG